MTGAHPGCTNIATNVPRLSVDEVFHGDELRDNGWRWMVRPWKKRVVWMKDTFCTFFKPEQLVLDPFAKVLCTVKACLLLQKHRRLVGCDKDVKCLQKYMQSFVEVYAFQILKERSGLAGEDEWKEKAYEYPDTVNYRRLKGSLDGWGAPPGLPSIQML